LAGGAVLVWWITSNRNLAALETSADPELDPEMRARLESELSEL
jgi:hypothetical protein